MLSTQASLDWVKRKMLVPVSRRIREFHSVGSMELAKRVEETVAFLGIPQSPHWFEEAAGGTPVNEQVWVDQKSAKRKCFCPWGLFLYI